MKKIVMGMAVALMTASCSVNDNEIVTIPEPVICPTDPIGEFELTRGEQVLVTNSNDFAFNLMREAYDGTKSQILSPISITYALGMLNNGAKGRTQQQINHALGFANADEVNGFCKKMLIHAPILDEKTKVMIANTIFMNKDYTLKQDFVQMANDYYLAQPETRDFADGQTMKVINQWASDHTEKMIEQVLDEDTFDPTSVSYLLNAIYFKGEWTSKFEKAMTTEETFSNGKRVPMMNQKKTFSYAEDENCQMLRLPYGNKAYEMTILLPRENKTVSDVLQTLTADRWANLDFAAGGIDVKLPRFESKTNMNLNPLMEKLGMTDAFLEVADFSGFCNVPVYIGKMLQSTRIKVDEEGSEAAAVTVIDVTVTAVEPEPRLVPFYATRPFLYVISEQSTGAVFFIGQYAGD